MPEDPPDNENESPSEQPPEESSDPIAASNGEEEPAEQPPEDVASEPSQEPAEVAEPAPVESEQNRTAASGFAVHGEDAEARYERWKAVDPFPNVRHALLNSGDIADYVAATGMIYPFHAELYPDKLKPASYEVDLLGRCVKFSGPRREDVEIQVVRRGDKYVVRENEIAFVQLEPMFRLPRYLALRFNLRIKHVYRGLLLGTGPLVDPGFIGHLWIPLHNLTSNDYEFEGGEGLVWMEFTKLSPILTEQERESTRKQKFFTDFPDEKIERDTIEDYLAYADPYRPIRSSIPALVDETKEDAARSAASAAEASERADQAAAEAEETRDWARNLAIAGAIGVLLALAAVIVASWSLMSSIRDRAEESLRKADRLEIQLEELEQNIQEQRPRSGRD